jgi:hypothetical protein
MSKHFTAGEIFTEATLNAALKVYAIGMDGQAYHIALRKLATADLVGINHRTGQKNDVDYLAYMLEHVVGIYMRNVGN